jgi:hypothetical protein
MSIFTRLGSKLPLPGVALGLALAGLGCNEGQEGDYCNPDLSHDECNSGLACTAASQLPATLGPMAYGTSLEGGAPWSPNAPCAENYCCPTSGASSNPVCQPGCQGGAASICADDPDATYACEFAEAIEAGEPLPAVDSGAPPAVDAAPEVAPDAVADAPTDAPEGG